MELPCASRTCSLQAAAAAVAQGEGALASSSPPVLFLLRCVLHGKAHPNSLRL